MGLGRLEPASGEVARPRILGAAQVAVKRLHPMPNRRGTLRQMQATSPDRAGSADPLHPTLRTVLTQGSRAAVTHGFRQQLQPIDK
jgi:hypothetical protein